MNAKLVAINGQKAGEEIPISAPTLRIGRGDDCDLQPPSKLIGRLHCVVSLDEDAVVIEDCGGAVGTFVNGVKLGHLRHELKNGDRIKIDKLEFEVQIVADESDEKRPPIPTMWDTTARSFSSTGLGEMDDDAAKSASQSWAGKKAELHEEKTARKWSGIHLLFLEAGIALVAIIVCVALPSEWGPPHTLAEYWTRLVWHLGKWSTAGWLIWGSAAFLLGSWTLFLSVRAWSQRRGGI